MKKARTRKVPMRLVEVDVGHEGEVTMLGVESKHLYSQAQLHSFEVQEVAYQ